MPHGKATRIRLASCVNSGFTILVSRVCCLRGTQKWDREKKGSGDYLRG